MVFSHEKDLKWLSGSTQRNVVPFLQPWLYITFRGCAPLIEQTRVYELCSRNECISHKRFETVEGTRFDRMSRCNTVPWPVHVKVQTHQLREMFVSEICSGNFRWQPKKPSMLKSWIPQPSMFDQCRLTVVKYVNFDSSIATSVRFLWFTCQIYNWSKFMRSPIYVYFNKTKNHAVAGLLPLS